MHGSVKDPYPILALGLLSLETPYFKDFKSKPQICLGLNNTNPEHTIKSNGSLKNTAVKYADYFSKDGIVYIISDEVKDFLTYKEEWEDFGTYKRGNAYLSEEIPSHFIAGVITLNLPKITAALTKSERKIPVYTPDGLEHQIKE
jgi:hypothetical protein